MDKRILACIFLMTSVLVCAFPFVVDRQPLVVVQEQQQIEAPVSQVPIVEPQRTPPPQQSPPVQINPLDSARASIREEDIRSLVTYLCSFQGRRSGTDACDAAALFIQDQFKNFGLQSEFHNFKMGQRDESPNVYGWIEGPDPRVLIVGAHYDHLGPGYPGADDNASGSAGVLILARAFSMIKSRVPKTLVFQLYSAEEYGVYGSKFYTLYPRFPRQSPSLSAHYLMINLDMIGHLGSKDVRSCFLPNATGGASDHMPFYNAGIPCFFVHTGMHGNYHKPTDTPESLDYSGMERLLRFTFDTIVYNLDQDKKVSLNPPKEPVLCELDHNSSQFLK